MVKDSLFCWKCCFFCQKLPNLKWFFFLQKLCERLFFVCFVERQSMSVRKKYYFFCDTLTFVRITQNILRTKKCTENVQKWALFGNIFRVSHPIKKTKFSYETVVRTYIKKSYRQFRKIFTLRSIILDQKSMSQNFFSKWTFFAGFLAFFTAKKTM